MCPWLLPSSGAVEDLSPPPPAVAAVRAAASVVSPGGRVVLSCADPAAPAASSDASAFSLAQASPVFSSHSPSIAVGLRCCRTRKLRGPHAPAAIPRR